jgi:hypothetical protein
MPIRSRLSRSAFSQRVKSLNLLVVGSIPTWLASQAKERAALPPRGFNAGFAKTSDSAATISVAARRYHVRILCRTLSRTDGLNVRPTR